MSKRELTFKKSKTSTSSSFPIKQNVASPEDLKKIQEFYGKYSKSFIDSDSKPMAVSRFNHIGESTDIESPEIIHLKAPKKKSMKLAKGKSPFSDERLQKLCSKKISDYK